MTTLHVDSEIEAKPLAIEYCNGVPMLPRRPNGPVVTMEIVNRILHEQK